MKTLQTRYSTFEKIILLLPVILMVFLEILKLLNTGIAYKVFLFYNVQIALLFGVSAIKQKEPLFKLIFAFMSIGTIGSILLFEHMPLGFLSFFSFIGLFVFSLMLMARAVMERKRHNKIGILFILLGLVNLVSVFSDFLFLEMHYLLCILNVSIIGIMILKEYTIPVKYERMLHVLFVVSVSSLINLIFSGAKLILA